jgi:hypothetical protein
MMILLATGNNMIAKIPTDGRDLIKMMHDKYNNNIFKTLSFSQYLIRFENNKEISREVMHEAYLAPGKLILTFNGWESGDGLLFRSDSIYTLDEGVIRSKERRIHDVLLLCFDIYNTSPEVTISKLIKLNYNLDKIQKIKYSDKDVFVVGDTDENCFWIDCESLMLLELQVRNINRARNVKLSNFQIFNSIPIATEIEFFDNNKNLEMVEKYFNVVPFAKLDASMFSPGNFIKSKW